MYIAKDELPAKLVKERFWEINSQNIEYLFKCMDKNKKKIKHMKNYLLASLFNSTATIKSHEIAENSAEIKENSENNTQSEPILTNLENENIVKQNISYDYLREKYPQERIDEIAGIITEIMDCKRDFIYVAGENRPAEIVKNNFSLINYTHIECVLSKFEVFGTAVKSVKNYLKSMLFNAPTEENKENNFTKNTQISNKFGNKYGVDTKGILEDMFAQTRRVLNAT